MTPEPSRPSIKQKKGLTIKMKKTTAIILACILCIAATTPAFAYYNYQFESGGDTLPGFGKSTSSDSPVPPDPMNENVRRNKDAALLPPPYFYGSGDIPTGPSSIYHDNLRESGFVPVDQFLPPVGNEDYAPGGASVTTGLLPPTSQISPPTSQISADTEPLYYEDGSIGTLHIERTGQTIKVYEGEDAETLKKGAGHFTSTSAWDGNIGLCAHNRGSWPYFAFVKDMQMGDKVTYTTLYGARTYEVFHKAQISEYDHTMLGWTAENFLTLITCIADVPELRWAAQLCEAR